MSFHVYRTQNVHEFHVYYGIQGGQQGVRFLVFVKTKSCIDVVMYEKGAEKPAYKVNEMPGSDVFADSIACIIMVSSYPVGLSVKPDLISFHGDLDIPADKFQRSSFKVIPSCISLRA